MSEEELYKQHNDSTECVCADCENHRDLKLHHMVADLTQSTLFNPDTMIENNWNGKYPCPICEKGKLKFSRTNTTIYIHCPKCHTSLNREYSKGEFEGKFDNE